MKNEKKIIVGAIAVVAIGAAVGLIIAATKKETVTEKITSWFWDFLDTSKDKLFEVADTLKDSITNKVKN